MTGTRIENLPELPPGAALWRGVVTALVVVLPVGILNQLAAEGDAPTVALLAMFVLILLGGAAGGWAVVRLSPAAPLSYSALASAGAYLIVQGIGIARRLAIGEELSWLAFPFLALLMATCGMLGGLFARRAVARYGYGSADADRKGGP